MNQYQGLLTTILHNLSNSTLFSLHIFHTNFINSVIAHFNSYLSSHYLYLVEMYPVHFMHIAFYDIYCKTYYPHYDISFFSNFFIPHQSQSGIKYKNFISVLKENFKNTNNYYTNNLYTNNLYTNLNDDITNHDMVKGDMVNVLVNNFDKCSI